ncbi:MAG TPA: oxidoreductase [Deltaproteobacteria bacterium]|nr:oxidoreductase [Deltaproteobacteria bacterium]
MANKPKMAICWFGGCGGCDEAIVDLNEGILKVTDAFDIVLWPVAMDFKYHHIEAMKDNEIVLSIINGSVRNSEHEELAHLLRKKSQYVLAFGACACFGGTPGMANLRSKEDIFQWVYSESPTVVNPKNNIPQEKTKVNGNELTLPAFYPQVFPLNKIIDVDYYLPGCPPPPDLIYNVVSAAISGDLPPKGSTLAPMTALCDFCERNKTKPERLQITMFHRIHEVQADPEKCFLAQGIICLGPATRGGCGEACIKINIPCRGCFGPVEGVKDMGTKYLSALASIIEGKTEEERKCVSEEVIDPVGYFYRFTTASSLLKKKRETKKA